MLDFLLVYLKIWHTELSDVFIFTNYMINQDLEKNPELKLAIMKQISGIDGIEIENIIPIETGSRSYCYIIKNTSKGDIFCKIDDETGAINFPARLKNETLARQENITAFQADFAQSTQNLNVTAPIVFQNSNGKFISQIPHKLGGFVIPESLKGKNITFMEKINANDFSIVRCSIDHTTNIKKLGSLKTESEHNQLPKILEDSQAELLDGLDLAHKRGDQFSFRRQLQARRTQQNIPSVNYL